MEAVGTSHKPMCITNHAEERMKARMGTKTNKLIKIAEKAWASKTTISAGYRAQAKADAFGNNRIVREFSGLLFVFKEERSQIVLLTVIHPKQLV